MGVGGGVLMAKNLLKKNIIKALIGSSVKGIWMDYLTLIWINTLSLSYEAYLSLYLCQQVKLSILFGQNNNFNFFLCCYLLQTNLHKMLKQNMYNVQI